MSVDLSKLQDAVGLLLQDDAGVTAVLGNHAGRIQGGTDPKIKPPYITIGEDDALDTSTDCLKASRVSFPIKIWTAEPGFHLNKKIASAVAALLDDTAFDVEGHRIVSSFVMSTRFFRDPAEGVRQGVVELQIDIEAVG